MKKVTLIIFLLTLSAMLIVGCSSTKTIVDEDGTTVTIDESNNEVTGTITDDEIGTTTYHAGEDLNLPDNWPQNDMPAYPGSKVVSTLANDSGLDGMATAIIAIGTNDDIDKVVAFYQDKISGATNTSSMQIEGIYFLGGEKSGYMYSITVTNEEEEDWDTYEEYKTYAIITYNSL